MSSTKSREVIWGGRIGAAKINAESTRQRAIEVAREADRAEAQAWSLRMEGYGGRRSPRRQLGSVSTVALAGWKSNAIVARLVRSFHSTRSGDRAIRGSGNWKPRCNVDHGGRAAISRPCI